MSPINIVDFSMEHVQEAEALARMNYAEERARVPLLPPVEPPELAHFAGNGLSVAATEGGKLVGFMASEPLFDGAFAVEGLRGAFVPMHAHGATREKRAEIYRRLYQAAARKWMNNGSKCHSIEVYAHDSEALEGLFVCGLGMRLINALRGTSPIPYQPQPDERLIELPKQRAGELTPLRRKLSAHLADSPCFMKIPSAYEEAWLERALTRDSRVFAAERDGRVVAFIETMEDGETFASEAPGSMNICGAYCEEEYRGSGLATRLLGFLIDELRAGGCERLGVDCESINPTAYSFWRKHFAFYEYGLTRWL